ncbi:MAG TPA: PilZ domain-containing protein [Candidatus Methylomirabilis sp.]|nr:PilZ domain-containing protein [Candidatus Methylomirabilis sp.]
MPTAVVIHRAPRYPMRLPLLHKPQVPALIRTGVGWTRDLSETGACVEVAETLQRQIPLCIRLQTGRGSIEAEAQVVWTGEFRPGKGGVLHGITFTYLAPTQLRALADLLLFKREVREGGIRLPMDLGVTCLPQGMTGPVQGRTGDLSSGGALLHLPQRLPARTELEVILHTSTGPVKAEGVVVWVGRPEGGKARGLIPHGFRFRSLNWSSSLALGLLLTTPS